MTKRILSFLMALMLLCGIASIAAAEEPVTLTIATTRRTTDITIPIICCSFLIIF